MEFYPYDIKNLKEILEKNKDFLESFFGENTFDEHFFNNIFKQSPKILTSSETINQETNARTIPMDMIQRKHEVILIFEIPGLNNAEDVDIKLLGSTLVITGEIRRNYMLSDKEIIKFERKVGRFSKKVALPFIVDNKRIHAKYYKGLLEVRVPIIKPNNYEKISVRFTDE
ncbi:hypothetical protein BHF71_02240 [Vulcanibacillus modesticaldus]|uniref:SHSP domain-containing protein n=1 Tax=Vulcanibacillus modesticaldus TaxID=337097 RepID=A0A1D2YTK0_9BACI|nr:Hsp20/alpha crystallin family protein [Vulcanibacillus modesticaldus]OEF99032.1 hypothetical protein BHF71_02240 [Vulcanibacillus modesticaldus]